MNARYVRLTLSFFVAFGMAAARVGAQAPLLPSSQPVDGSPTTPLSHLFARAQPSMDNAAFPRLNAHGYWCTSDPRDMGCGNWRTQNLFVFGSCRTFFDESCNPHPAHHWFDRALGWRKSSSCRSCD